MLTAKDIPEHAEVRGADDVHVGTVDHIVGDRIKLTRTDSPQPAEGLGGRHHFLPVGLVALVKDGTVFLSADAAVAVDLFEEA